MGAVETTATGAQHCAGAAAIRYATAREFLERGSDRQTIERIGAEPQMLIVAMPSSNPTASFGLVDHTLCRGSAD